MTYSELVLENKDVFDAKNLILGLKEWNLTDYVLHGTETPDEAFLSVFRAGIGRLREGEPVQYVLSRAYFFGYPFYVDRNVLIPRLDTEILVSEVLRDLRKEPEGTSLLDLCTGSGCIGITLKKECPRLTVTLSDISEGAVKVAEKNRKNLEAEARIVQSDLFNGLPESFDRIVSNPPYIPTGEIGTLDDCVKNYEPGLALDGSPDGLRFYRRIGKEAKKHLNPGGKLFLEIGSDQGETVPEILREEGYRDIRMIRDLAGLPRVVRAGI